MPSAKGPHKQANGSRYRPEGLQDLEEVVICPAENQIIAAYSTEYMGEGILWRPAVDSRGSLSVPLPDAVYRLKTVVRGNRNVRRAIFVRVEPEIREGDIPDPWAEWTLVSVGDYRLSHIGKPVIAADLYGEIVNDISPEVPVRILCVPREQPDSATP